MNENDPVIKIRRHWNYWQIGSVNLSQIEDLKWDIISGGIQMLCPQPFIHGYVLCDQINGEINHSCLHGGPPHRIKVCLVKKDNKSETWKRILEIIGPKH